MKGTKSKEKVICSCLMLISLGMFLYVYLILCPKYEKKTETMKQQEQEVQQQIEERQKKNKESGDMGTDMAIIKVKMNGILHKYPSRVTLPDVLLLLQKFQNENEIEISNINIGEISPFCNTTIPKMLLDDERGGLAGPSTNPCMTGIKGTVQVTFCGSYENVKKWLKYLAEYNQRMSMDGITLVYDETTELVNGTMSIDIYGIEGNGQPYKAPVIDDIEVGKKMILGYGK